jgi:hypothetical protein
MQHPGGFQIVGESSRQIVIPPEFCNVVNTDSRFSTIEPLTAFIKLDFPGFEGSKSILGESASRNLFINMLRTKLNQNLSI